MAIIPAVITVGMLIYPLAFNIWTSLHVDRLCPRTAPSSG